MSEKVRFSATIEALLAAAPPMPLDAGDADAALADQLMAFNLESSVAPTVIRDRAAAQACLAGLWLRTGDLDRSHRISQELDTPEGNFWHAIMHRRESDYGNSKYWFRRVGRHLAFARIETNWHPFVFVDRVEAYVTRGIGDEKELCDLQAREWDALFEFCWIRAVG